MGEMLWRLLILLFSVRKTILLKNQMTRQMKPGSNRPRIHPRTRHKNRIKSLLRVREIRYRSHLDQA